MRVLSSLLELVGALVVIAGLALFDWRAGLIAAGFALILAGFLMDSPKPVSE